MANSTFRGVAILLASTTNVSSADFGVAFDVPVVRESAVAGNALLLTDSTGAFIPGRLDIGIPFNAVDVSGGVVRATLSVPINQPLAAEPGDILVRTNNVWSIAWNRDQLGLPSGVAIDALARDGNTLLFSVDAPWAIGGTRVSPAHILRFDGNQVSVHVSASTLGLPDGADVTALDMQGGQLRFSTSTPGAPANEAVVYRLTPGGPVVDFSISTTKPAGVVAITVLLPEEIFSDQFEN